jgi:ribosomal protein S18 acetylase RimI-like enzyme
VIDDMNFDIREMTVDDYDEALALWKATEEIDLSDGDDREGVALCLARNPGLSFVARVDKKLIGAVLCGHDGRRGYLYHLTVVRQYRNKGVGRALVDRCLSALKKAGIRKCNIFLYSHNHEAKAFWEHGGWFSIPDLDMMQKILEE